MKNKWVVSIAGLCALLMSSSGMAQDAFSLDAGRSSESTTALRLGAQWDFDRTLWQSNSGQLRLNGYWDLAATYWGSLDTVSLDASPVLRLNIGSAGRTPQAYLEAGIGVAWFSRSRLAPGTRLGSSLQFADRLGVGMRLANGDDVAIRYFHYSNAGFNRRNSGVDKLVLHYRLNF
ncbi:acyloxyacyl hydrolase [Halopseudomonas salegens]|uniref:Lipid A 3-O-deacylase n=1 Tax=Halopseudomonas salegens TaxID=1434072 RepID=A0A1H2GM32_9GAMM|nr:acyloxyacyl hydrolase [Halopseudomonas salegens]SDU20713.1 lipid A 3-O-deacylase [Halopseudomonas salegens]